MQQHGPNTPRGAQPAGRPNLRPYGHVGVNIAAGANAAMQRDEYASAALERATAKLADLRTGRTGDQPAALSLATQTGNLAASAILLLMAASNALRFHAEGNQTAVLVCFVLGAVFVVWPILYLPRSRPSTPQRLLADYYRSLGAGRHARARQHVVKGDLDHFVRVQPSLGDFGKPSRRSFTFADPEAAKSYWNELLRWHPLPYCTARVDNVRVTMFGPDVAVVDFRLQLWANTRWWFVAVAVLWVIALLVEAFTRKKWNGDMRKVVVRVGDGWKMFNGEWQGPEERDLSWLPTSTS